MKKDPVTLNAEGKSLGRVASEAAMLLRGKRSPDFERHILSDQRVIITNAAHVKFTGTKLKSESRKRYSGYPGGLKSISHETLFKKNPTQFVAETVAGMIPQNRLKKEILKHLTVYAEGQK